MELAGGRKVKFSISFECANDDFVAMTAEEQETPEMGLEVTPVAQMTVLTDDQGVESSLFMTRDELRRLVFEAVAVYKTMEESARLADVEWARYRQGVRRRTVAQTTEA